MPAARSVAGSEWSARAATRVVSWVGCAGAPRRSVIRPVRRVSSLTGSERSRAASSGVSRKSRGRAGVGCARVACDRASRSAWSDAHDGQVATQSCAVVRSGPARSPSKRLATSAGSWPSWRPVASTTEQLHPVLEQAAQRETAAVDPRLDGPERDPRHLGDLRVVVALDVVQDDRGPLVVGDLGKSTAEDPRALAVEGGPLRISLD